MAIITRVRPGAAAHPRLGGGVLLLLIGVGCDSGPAELAQEINAAREGCTEEMLKASDEECIQMFERYADMGADAMETYIGGMKAFDQAIQRRGGLQFDTAGLGHAFSAARVDGAADSLSGDEISTSPLRSGAQGGYTNAAARVPEWESAGSATSPNDGGRWEDMPADGGVARRAPLPASTARPARGALLPPEERLRRPWIDDEPAQQGPTREETPPPAPTRPRPLPSQEPWDEQPLPQSSSGRW